MTKLTHMNYAGTMWPLASWYACCFVFERNALELDCALFKRACADGIVFG